MTPMGIICFAHAGNLETTAGVARSPHRRTIYGSRQPKFRTAQTKISTGIEPHAATAGATSESEYAGQPAINPRRGTFDRCEEQGLGSNQAHRPVVFRLDVRHQRVSAGAAHNGSGSVRGGRARPTTLH